MKRILVLLFALAVACTPQNPEIHLGKNDVPNVPADKVLETVVQSFPGKVVLVNLWATWCGPCSVAHSALEPLKNDRLKDVVFVYFAGPSSPSEDWNKAIDGILGHHFYLNLEQINSIFDQVDSKAYPTFLLYGKDGNMAGKWIGFHEKEMLEAIDNALKQ